MADYRGLPGAFVFALRRSESYLFKGYVLASAIVGAFATVVLLLGLVSWLASPRTPFGQQALLTVIAILLLLPLFAPVLIVARRHRTTGSSRRDDAALGLAGFGVVLSIWLALYVSAPERSRGPGPLEPALAALGALPRAAWPLPPLLAVGLLVLAVHHTRPGGSGSDGPDGAPGDSSSGAEDATER